jgi:hypothetical protein
VAKEAEVEMEVEEVEVEVEGEEAEDCTLHHQDLLKRLDIVQRL